MKHNRMAHRSKEGDIKKFYDYMNGKKRIYTSRDIKDFEAYYFSMLLLLPEKPLMDIINLEFMGGINLVKNDKGKTKALARIFNVEEELVEIRINDIIERQEEAKKQSLKLQK